METKFKLGDTPYKLQWVHENGILFTKPVQYETITKIEIVEGKCSPFVLYNETDTDETMFKTKEEALKQARINNAEHYGKLMRDFEELKRKGYA